VSVNAGNNALPPISIISALEELADWHSDREPKREITPSFTRSELWMLGPWFSMQKIRALVKM
jgi:hypothetical protein